MITLIGFSGSLRQGSYNTALLRAAATMMPEGSRLEIASIRSVPLYDGDEEEAHGIPAAVVELKDRIAAADGLLLSTPEYNYSVPGVAKNAIDWLSRPPTDIVRVFAAKPVAIVGASVGPFATVQAQNAWLPVFRVLGAEVWNGGRLAVGRAAKVFDAEGRIVDDAVGESLRKLLAGFVAFVQGRPR